MKNNYYTDVKFKEYQKSNALDRYHRYRSKIDEEIQINRSLL